MYKHIVNTAKSVECGHTAYINCKICTKKYLAGAPPSYYVVTHCLHTKIENHIMELNNPANLSNQDWVCSLKCANFWILQRL